MLTMNEKDKNEMLHFGKEKMKISLMNNAIGFDIQG